MVLSAVPVPLPLPWKRTVIWSVAGEVAEPAATLPSMPVIAGVVPDGNWLEELMPTKERYEAWRTMRLMVCTAKRVFSCKRAWSSCTE